MPFAIIEKPVFFKNGFHTPQNGCCIIIFFWAFKKTRGLKNPDTHKQYPAALMRLDFSLVAFVCGSKNFGPFYQERNCFSSMDIFGTTFFNRHSKLVSNAEKQICHG